MSEANGAAVLKDVAEFESSALKHIDVIEKVQLPSVGDIESEKKHLSLIDGVENFKKGELKPTVTEEKIILPDAETLEKERKNKAESQI